MQIEHVSPDQLRPCPNNARTHSRKQIKRIANSIERFGFCNPVLVDDKNQIVAGHGRVAAAKLLQLDTVPVVHLSHLNDAEKRAYILADNKLAEKAGWDRDLLASELQGLIDLDFEIDLTGFEASEVELILGEGRDLSEGQIAREDESPICRNSVVVSRPNDLWALADHRLLVADAREQAFYDVLLDGETAQCVFTDPLDSIMTGFRHNAFSRTAKAVSDGELVDVFTTIFERLAANTAAGSIHMVCMEWQQQTEVLAAGRNVYSELLDLCVWNKSNPVPGTFYRAKHELIYVWKNGTASPIANSKRRRLRSNVWNYREVPTQTVSGPEHIAARPTVKPVALVEDAIKDISVRGELVLDPCAHKGTVLIAAERIGRKARAMEIDPTYADVAVRRWQSLTGKSAVLVATGETFAQRERMTCPRPA